jgi:hypothetical protein
MQILLLIVHGSRVPLWVFICFAGNRSVIKKFLVGASLVFSALVLMCYYLGSDNIFARGITVRRTLYDAVASNNTAAVSYMLAQPGLGGGKGGRTSASVVDDDTRGWPFGYTALHEACRKGNTVVVDALLKNGADVSKVNVFGDTALSMSSCNGHVAVVRRLLEAGADVNHRNSFGDTPLILASYHGHSELVRVLLRSGASVGALNMYGDTALTLAARRRHGTVLRQLQSVKTRRSWASLVTESRVFCRQLSSHSSGRRGPCCSECGSMRIRCRAHLDCAPHWRQIQHETRPLSSFTDCI